MQALARRQRLPRDTAIAGWFPLSPENRAAGRNPPPAADKTRAIEPAPFFFIRREQIGVERRLRIVDLRQRRGLSDG